MRIDPSQLAEPLAHILGAGATDAAQGQKAAAAGNAPITDPQLEQLDALLLRRLQLQQTAGAADSVINFQDAIEKAARIRELAGSDPGAVARAQGGLDPTRVRGLLGD